MKARSRRGPVYPQPVNGHFDCSFAHIQSESDLGVRGVAFLAEEQTLHLGEKVALAAVHVLVAQL
jgi:hypothetical protein